MKAPCQGCEMRRVGCHGSCGKYQAYSQQQEQIRQQRADRNDYTSAREGVFLRTKGHKYFMERRSRGK